MTQRLRTWAIGMALVVGSTTGACGDDGASTATSSTPPSTSPTPEAASAFLVRSADEWVPLQATFPAKGASPTEPSLDWWVEYERPPTSSPQRVRLSGHRLDADTLTESLVGFSLEPAEIRGSSALAGQSSEPNGPSIVVLPVSDDYAVMALSYELAVSDLITWAGGLTEATESEWTTANATAPTD